MRSLLDQNAFRHALAAALALAIAPAPLAAATCNVPSGGHPTIDSAVRDPACTTAQLAAGSFAESVEIGRDFALVGAGPAASAVAGAGGRTGAGSVGVAVGTSLWFTRLIAGKHAAATACRP